MARPFQDHFLPPQLAASTAGGVDLQNKWYAIFIRDVAGVKISRGQLRKVCDKR